ncbi:MAG: holo-ACP synthase [Pseudobutyrivibrio sp.]|nr:holo-ACP synthase [Pseudobutyrivibrio sp.]
MGNVLGVGIDLVSISEIRDLDERTKGAFVQKTYTARELEDAGVASNFYEFLAGRFAVKEAVYKAFCGNFPDVNFDFRKVETIKLQNGAPKVQPDVELLKIMADIGASNIFVSISNQGDFATAIAELCR